jgi:hypothetical protein
MTTMTGQALEDLANELYAIGVWSSVIAAGVGLIRLLRPLHDQRLRARVIEQNRIDEIMIRLQYSEWLDDALLKLEIDALNAPTDENLQRLRQRIEEAKISNSRYLGDQHEEPISREVIQREWNQLRKH